MKWAGHILMTIITAEAFFFIFLNTLPEQLRVLRRQFKRDDGQWWWCSVRPGYIAHKRKWKRGLGRQSLELYNTESSYFYGMWYPQLSTIARYTTAGQKTV
jgi:hypothetical protein